MKFSMTLNFKNSPHPKSDFPTESEMGIFQTLFRYWLNRKKYRIYIDDHFGFWLAKNLGYNDLNICILKSLFIAFQNS